MAVDTILGIHWDNNALYVTAVDENRLEHVFFIPITLEGDETSSEVLGPYTERVAIALTDTIKEKKIETKDVVVSVPTKDIIFRTFVIPQIPQQEIKGAIDFEVTKYIPFGLDEIAYAYHTVPIVENDVKRYKVIFIGIRKNVLLKYTAALQKAGANALIIEPAAISLIRVLFRRQLIPEGQSLLVVEKEDDTGRIIVLEEGVPHFIREFQLTSGDMAQGSVDAVNPGQKLMNEIQISLNYFGRQEPNVSIDKVVMLSKTLEGDLMTGLEEFLNIPVIGYECRALMEYENVVDIPFLTSLGASISLDEILPFEFSFLGKTKNIKRKKKKKKHDKPLVSGALLKTKNIVQTFCVGVIVLGLIFTYTHKEQNHYKQKIASLEKNLGTYRDMDTASIEGMNAKYRSQLTAFKAERSSSDTYKILTELPNLISEGVWFRTLRLAFDNTSQRQQRSRRQRANTQPQQKQNAVKLSVSGFTYREDPNEQFQSVSQFLGNLRNSKLISENFSQLNLKTTESQKMDIYDVTYFEVESE